MPLFETVAYALIFAVLGIVGCLVLAVVVGV